VKLGAKIFGILSLSLLGYLLLGLLLPGTWEAEVEQVVPASPSRTFSLINNLGAWSSWSPMPEAGVSTFGAEEGAGAGLRWDDPRYGQGEVRILKSQANRSVEYRVEVEGGKLTILGSMTLDSLPHGTRVRWREEGDFGWNPLLGYAARGMQKSQGTAMAESLGTLSRILEEGQEGGPESSPRESGEAGLEDAGGDRTGT